MVKKIFFFSASLKVYSVNARDSERQGEDSNRVFFIMKKKKWKLISSFGVCD